MDERVILARALPPPVDVAVDGHFAGKLAPALAVELRGWIIIAVSALALAGAMAVLIALARVPGAEQILPFADKGFFQRGLVAHVTFAFVVWYLGIQGALTVLATARLRSGDILLSSGGVWVGRVSLAGAGLSFLLLLIPALRVGGTASLNNYVPVLTDPLYYAGLVLLAVSLAAPVARLLFAVARLRDVEPATFGIGAAGVIYLIALLCFLMAWFTRPVGFDAEGLNEYLMWGGGHILQFTNTALFLCCLFLVTRVAFGETALSPALFKAMMLLMVAGAAAGPLLYLTYPGGDPTQRVLFTNLYWYALPVPSAVIGVSVLALLMRRWHDIWAGAPEVRGAAAALLLFGFGGVIGFFESSVDTRTPGHYHAVLIAVTIVFMALTLAVFLPILGRRSEQRRLRTVIYLTMAVGTLVQSIGLFAAGVLGVARKTAGAEQGLDSAEKMFAMLLNGIGGGVAAIGGIIFIVMAGKLLLAKPNHGVTAASLTGAGHH